jgi:hypothetical protein
MFIMNAGMNLRDTSVKFIKLPPDLALTPTPSSTA